MGRLKDDAAHANLMQRESRRQTADAAAGDDDEWIRHGNWSNLAGA
jgi:hypothetical protein